MFSVNVGTSHLLRHLKNAHANRPTVETALEKIQAKRTSGSYASKRKIIDLLAEQQLSPYPSTHPLSVNVHRAILENIAVHNKPFLSVEDPCQLQIYHLLNPQFVCKKADYFSQQQLEESYEWAQDTMSKRLQGQYQIHFTSDLYKNRFTGHVHLSLTAHWIDNQTWEYHHAQIATKKVRGLHKNETIFVMWVNSLVKWNLLRPKDSTEHLPDDVNSDKARKDYITYDHTQFRNWMAVGSMTGDEGSNVVAAVKRFPNAQRKCSLSCVLHRVQLASHKACRSVRNVSIALLHCKGTTEYILRSDTDRDCLFQLQKEDGVARPIRVVLECVTRWDSEYDSYFRNCRLKHYLFRLYEHEDIYKGSANTSITHSPGLAHYTRPYRHT